MIIPKFNISVSGSTVTITPSNRGDRDWGLYRSKFQNQEVALVSEQATSSATDTIDDDWRASYLVRYRDIEASVTITEDNSDLTPPYYVADAKNESVFTNTTETIIFDWGSVVVDTITIDPVSFGIKSKRKYT